MADKHAKEAIYDEQISPLMTQIIAICKEAKINMLADFSLGVDPKNEEPLFCTTLLSGMDDEDAAGSERMKRAYGVLRPSSGLMAITIFGGGNG